MTRRPWRTIVARITGDQVDARVASARADIHAVLGHVLDDEEGLARIYAAHGQQPPARPGPAAIADEGGQVQEVCDRIAMLEITLAQAGRPDGPSSAAGTFLDMAARFLFELRSGLASRSLSADDAFRLLTSVRHDLQEADKTLGEEQQLPLGDACCPDRRAARAHR